MITLPWLPEPIEFRQGLKSALAGPEAGERLERLWALSQSRLGFLETIQLDTALRQCEPSSAPGFTPIRLALLGSATLDHLLPSIRVAGLRRRLLLRIHSGSFGQYRRELMQPDPALQAFAPELLLLSLSARDLLGQISVAANAADADLLLAQAVDDLRGLWRQARERHGATVIQQTFLDVREPLFGSYDRQVPGAPARLTARLNERVIEAAATDGVLLLDVDRASAQDGIGAWFDIARWLQAKIEIAPQAAPLYGDLLSRLIAAQRGLSRKCLVLDLDNTLWGGVVGDVGVNGIVLGEGSAAGEAHLALQRYAKTLSERGIVLAVCSKNELAAAEEPFRNHPEMILEREDIAAFVANWEDKAENLRSIATQLNIGLDSLVFVDDNPAERARVRESLPMVAVPELPDDPAHYVRTIADAGYFEAIAFTEDDRQRVQQYAANAERVAARDSIQSMDDYLRGLRMSVEYGPVTAVDLPRVTQLINKTNQFNTTTRRLTSDEVTSLTTASQNISLRFRLLDRFGDNGLVSVMILCPMGSDSSSLELTTWVMSCRVFGRQLEDEAMNIAVETARARGTRALFGDIIATKKNSVIAGLYDNLGFSRIEGDLPAGTSRWTVDLTHYVPRRTFINRVPA